MKNSNNYVLPKIFNPTSLKIIEFFLRKEKESKKGTEYNLGKFAEEAGISKGALHNAIKILEDYGIIISREKPVNGGYAKIIEIDWDNELVYLLMNTLSAFIKFVDLWDSSKK